jgi:hypothetical protein
MWNIPVRMSEHCQIYGPWYKISLQQQAYDKDPVLVGQLVTCSLRMVVLLCVISDELLSLLHV